MNIVGLELRRPTPHAPVADGSPSEGSLSLPNIDQIPVVPERTLAVVELAMIVPHQTIFQLCRVHQCEKSVMVRGNLDLGGMTFTA